jgi:hypothetical protein
MRLAEKLDWKGLTVYTCAEVYMISVNTVYSSPAYVEEIERRKLN